MAFFSDLFAKLSSVNPETGSTGWEGLGKIGAGLQMAGGDAPQGNAAQEQLQTIQAARQKSVASRSNIQYLDEIAQRLGLTPNMRLLLRSSPDKFADVLAKNLEAYNLTEGMGHYNPGFEEDNRYNPRTFAAGDEIIQTQEGGGVDSVYTRQPSFAEDTDRMKTEFDINKPVSVAEGAILYNPYTGEKLIENVKNFAPSRASSGSKGMPPPPPGAVIVGGR